MPRASTSFIAHPDRPLTRRPRGVWWLLLLHLFVASPCAIELGLGSLALALTDHAPAIPACCANHDERSAHRGSSSDDSGDDSGDHSAPDAQRSACGCCHSLHPTTLPVALVDTVRISAPRARDTMTGEPADGHTRLPFRPPTHA